MVRNIDTGLSELNEKLLAMAGNAEQAIDCSIGAWRERDREKLNQVFAIEDDVNQAHKDVDTMCLRLLALQQPMAVELRLILSVVKINSELERIVDQAVNISHNAQHYLKFPPSLQLKDLSTMSDRVKKMVRETIDAFVRKDVDLARAVLEADDEVDELKDKIFRDVQTLMKTNAELIEPGLTLILIARNLERMGDHATNVAEDVIFTVSGEDIRHQGKSATPRPARG